MLDPLGLVINDIEIIEVIFGGVYWTSIEIFYVAPNNYSSQIACSLLKRYLKAYFNNNKHKAYCAELFVIVTRTQIELLRLPI